MMNKIASEKSYGVAVSLSGIFGIFGIHHFYLGCWLHGVIDLGMTLTALYLIMSLNYVAGLALLAVDIIHTFIVTIMLLTGAYKDGNGHYVVYPGQKLN